MQENPIRACEGRSSCTSVNPKNFEIEIMPDKQLENSWRHIEKQIREKMGNDPQADEKVYMIKKQLVEGCFEHD